MSRPLLEIEQLRTWLDLENGAIRAVDGLSLTVAPGETFALLGESGCGKSMTALSVMRLLPDAGRIVGGRIRLEGTDLLTLPEFEMRKIRGGRIGMIFQEPMLSLNPVMTAGEQIREVLHQHEKVSREEAFRKTLELLDSVGIPEPGRLQQAYPFQLSGGQKQRVMIAMALACRPDLLIADEPTTALDVTIQAQILELLREQQRKSRLAILLITHDLGVVSEMAHQVAVMYAGEIVEKAPRERFFEGPAHPYSRKLLASLPTRGKRGRSLSVIRGSVPSLLGQFSGCRFWERCDSLRPECRQTPPPWIEGASGQGVRCHLYGSEKSARLQGYGKGPEKGLEPPGEAGPSSYGTISDTRAPSPLLAVKDLRIYFPIRKGLLKRTVGQVKAVDGISFDLPAGKTLALVGESGCGKTTAAKGMLRLIRPTAGSVRFQDRELTNLKASELRPLRRELQIIFQDPFSSLNPRMRVKEIIEEGMAALRVGSGAAERGERLEALLREVGLPGEVQNRYPHEFSGGQRQRIAIARALSVNPRLVFCDEPTSALDISVQAQILNLLKGLQERYGLSYLFITHNISVVGFLAHSVMVMYLGRIVEQGKIDEVLDHPNHPYTRALLSAVPVIDQTSRREVVRLAGDLPSPVNPPAGCHFHPRCPAVLPQCRRTYPAFSRFSPTHQARCHLYPPDQENN
jgi:peptide/nickel transport system ATP-binding protein